MSSKLEFLNKDLMTISGVAPKLIKVLAAVAPQPRCATGKLGLGSSHAVLPCVRALFHLKHQHAFHHLVPISYTFLLYRDTIFPHDQSLTL